MDKKRLTVEFILWRGQDMYDFNILYNRQIQFQIHFCNPF